MKLLIVAVLVFVSSLAGVLGASLILPSAPAASEDASHAPEKSEENGNSHQSDSHRAPADKPRSEDLIYFKFSREFVVPIMRDGEVKSLVILNMQIEADPSVSDVLFRTEPKLRDNIMTTLISLSHETSSLQNFAEVSNFETIRALVLQNLKEVVPEGLSNVLIVDIGRQDL